jgi:hypothetical protein
MSSSMWCAIIGLVFLVMGAISCGIACWAESANTMNPDPNNLAIVFILAMCGTVVFAAIGIVIEIAAGIIYLFDR